MGLNSISPSDFGKQHRALFEQVIGKKAADVGAKSLSTKLHLDIAYGPKDGDLGLMFDNLKAIEDTRKGSIPLKEAYDIDEQLAAAAAAQAAKTTGGKLTPLSARFLPVEFRADYERLTGLKASDKPGTAVDGVTLKRTGDTVDVKIDFEKSLKGVTADKVVLALSEHFQVVAERVNPPADPKLPPYWVYISPRDGLTKDGTEIHADTGISGFNGADTGHLIDAGKDVTVHLESNNKQYETMTFHLDKVNDIGSGDSKPASDATKPARDAWLKLFSKNNADFDVEKGIAKGTLTKKTLAEVRDVPGIKTLFTAIRDSSGSAISKLDKKGLLTFVEDPKTHTLGVLRRYDGEGGCHLSIVDLDKKRWVGTFSVGDDGTKSWNER